ncbi:MAG: hypothetical protein EOP06_32275 [Proteobacteria bacterium]|nr:MAG: hypothetical protein EOP06_32275 [Pseudomonadota bacterium]
MRSASIFGVIRLSRKTSAMVSPGEEAQSGLKSVDVDIAEDPHYFDTTHPYPVNVTVHITRDSYMIGNKFHHEAV